MDMASFITSITLVYSLTSQCSIKNEVDEFYSSLEDTLALLSKTDIKVVSEDCDAKVRKIDNSNSYMM